MLNDEKQFQPVRLGSKGLRAFISKQRGMAIVILKGSLSPTCKVVFDRAYDQIEKMFPAKVTVDAGQLICPEDRKGLEAFTAFISLLRAKGNRLQIVGMKLSLAEPLVSSGAVHKEELSASLAEVLSR